ncbi:hypothetical protein [Shewanella pealeana]|uniref:Uncharacterized protein n=1 Tax=Shewanella pealeana (strain ATCC 700345 / ANG-SQ1) TaxID=398579 RepID=A8H1N3_SHEPA|nr:hypothetical protein [Shewanella pealeana]ABV86470.1 conserved hypothetical protein [Shewanella pealeana ATCC 700345]
MLVSFCSRAAEPQASISQTEKSIVDKSIINKSIIKTSMTKAAFFTSLISLCATSLTAANATELSCNDIDANHLSATYKVHHASGQQSTMTLLRNKDQVIYQRSPVSFEMWNKQGEYVRYFPEQQRSISYRKGDLRSLNMHFDFEQLNHLVSTSLISKLTQSEQAIQPIAADRENQITALECLNANRYHGALHLSQVQLVWAEKIALPVTMDVTMDMQQANQKVSYQLTSLKALSNDDFTSLISGYRDMDFADVGDNESDPFIAKMIHQGFIQHGSSGFYDSQGNQLSGGDSGHQH